MTKLDFKKRDRPLYSGTVGRWDTLEVPEMSFLTTEGRGDPNGPAYARAVSALYPLAYALKGAAKADGADFVVPPLEALWWADDPRAFARNDRSAWRWTVMLRVPDAVGDADLAAAQATCRPKLARKGPNGAAALDEVRLARLAEGTCLQTLHVGPYSAEAPVLADLHERWMPGHRLTFDGPHHEIYLSDPRRVPPERLKTLLRQPVRPLDAPPGP